MTSEQIPFYKHGNRLVLSLEQILNDKELEDFFNRFRLCFTSAVLDGIIGYYFDPSQSSGL